jgi:hypothetical protein
MKIQISQSYKHGYFDLTFDDETEIVKYYKDGGGECWHDVNIALIESWAKEHGYIEDLDLISFVEMKIKAGLAQEFVSMIEAKTTATSTWMSSGDIEGMFG